MTDSNQRPYASRLATRFAVILAMALLPAGVVAFLQTKALEAELTNRAEVALIGSTIKAAADETVLISRVRGMVSSLAHSVALVIDDPDACSALMRDVAAAETSEALVGFVPASGIMTCSSSGVVQDYNGFALFDEIVKADRPFLFAFPKGPVSGTSILGITHPVYTQDGTYAGYAVITLAHSTLREMGFSSFVERSGFEVPVAYWTFDRNGNLLSANIDLKLAEDRIPSDRPLTSYVGTSGEVFRAMPAVGKQMTYAVAPIVEGELYLMSSFLPEERGVWQNYGLAAYLPTLLMWLAGLVASAFAAEVLVAQYVRRLNRSILSFAQGDRRLHSIDLTHAPAELNELATAYLAMTESITRSEALLEDSLHQKEVLLREVHHRVKNNLQLISSIMNIQIRSARSGEAKDLLKNLQERVMSLATVHRGLYQTSGLADVRARELIPDIVRQIISMSSSPEKPFQTENDIDDLRLVPDQAVPLSLLLAEALTNAIKHAGATRAHPGKLIVRLKRSGGSEAVLEVINSTRTKGAADQVSEQANTGIGSQLITAFVQQLGGQKELGELDGDYFLRVIFSVSPLSTAENRQAPDSSDSAAWNQSTS